MCRKPGSYAGLFKILCYLCIPSSPELGFPVFPVFVFRSVHAMAN